MKTIQLFVILLLFSLHAGATGYSHNMFVAHNKLQSVTVVSEKAAENKVKAVKVKTQKQVAANPKAVAVSSATTLNARIVEEGPASFFASEDESESDSTIVTKLVDMVKCVIYAMVGYPALRH